MMPPYYLPSFEKVFDDIEDLDEGLFPLLVMLQS